MRKACVSLNTERTDAVDLLRARQVVAERLLEHDAHVRAVQPGGAELLADLPGTGAGWWRGTAPRSSALRARVEPVASAGVVLGLRQVHAQVVQQRGEARELLVARAAWRTRRPGSAPAARRGSRRRSARRARRARMRPPAGSLPWRKAWNSAGISLRQARSPVPPKRTRSNDMVRPSGSTPTATVE